MKFNSINLFSFCNAYILRYYYTFSNLTNNRNNEALLIMYTYITIDIARYGFRHRLEPKCNWGSIFMYIFLRTGIKC